MITSCAIAQGLGAEKEKIKLQTTNINQPIELAKSLFFS